MLNLIASARQPNALLPSRQCCSCFTVPRLPEKLMLQVQSSIGASVMVAVTTTPLEIVKTRLQIAPSIPMDPRHLSARFSNIHSYVGSTSRSSTYQILKSILKSEGIGGLWTGTGAAIVHAVPSVSIYFVFYEQLKSKFEEFGVPNIVSPVLAGALARSVSVLITVRQSV
jgi:hypothetical protein